MIGLNRFAIRGSVVLAVVLASSISLATTVYIAPDGDDGNDGADGAPVKTLARAYALAANDGDVIQFADGMYTPANFTTTLQVKRGITLSGNGADRSRVVFDLSESTLANLISVESAITNEAFAITGMTFRDSSATTLLKFANAKISFLMRDCAVSGFSTRIINLVAMTALANDSQYSFKNVSLEHNVYIDTCLMSASGTTGNSVFEFEDCRFIDNGQTAAASNPGVIRSSVANSRWSFTDCLVPDCYSTNSNANAQGGFLSIHGTGTQTLMNNCTFTNVVATKGGAIAYGAVGSRSEFLDCRFIDCAASGSTADGGAFWFDNKLYTNSFVNCSFETCRAPNRGGAIYMNSSVGGELEISNCVFEACVGANGGGALAVNAYQVRISDTLFSSNSVSAASKSGGAILFSALSSFRDYNQEFVRCTFVNNVATSNGGGISSGAGSVRLRDSTFQGCTATFGGAMFLGGSFWSHSISNCTFDSCRSVGAASSANGAALHVNAIGESFDIDDCTFTKCRTDGFGAVYYAVGNAITNTTFNRCRIVGNVAFKHILYKNGRKGYEQIVMRNSVIEGNKIVDLSDGNVAIVRTGETLMENCTVANNLTGKGWAVGDSETWTLRNNIVWNNISQSASVSNRNFSCTASKNLFENNISDQDIAEVTGSGNLMRDPQFTSVGTWDENLDYNFDGDYTIAKRSPARDAGKKLDWMTASTLDFIGNPRISGSCPDIGAYEYKPISGLTVIFR